VKKNNYKEFCLWFVSRKTRGFPITLNDMREKATELKLPITIKYRIKKTPLRRKLGKTINGHIVWSLPLVKNK
jgi:hypothetical protein